MNFLNQNFQSLFHKVMVHMLDFPRNFAWNGYISNVLLHASLPSSYTKFKASQKEFPVEFIGIPLFSIDEK